MLQIGDKALDFTLLSDKGVPIKLSDYKDKYNVVLYFYPKDNTSGCTKEACSFRDNMKQFQEKDTVILGVSPDSVKSHQNFISKQNLNFNLLSDSEHEVAEIYGAWGEKKMYGRTYFGIIRSTFIIGKDGLIKQVYKKVKVTGHTEIVLSQI